MTLPRWTQSALGYLAAAACLIWVFHDIHPERLLDHIAGLEWSWVAVAVVFDVLSYLCQGIRWRLLLAPVGRVSTLKTTEAIYVGLFASELFPLRAGELVRAYIIAKRTGSNLVSVIPSMAVERLFDGLWLAAAMGVTAILVPLPRDLAEAADILGATVLAATMLFGFILLRRPGSETRSGNGRRWKFGWRPVDALHELLEGLRVVGRTRGLLPSMAVSLLVLTFQAAAFWMVMYGYGLRLSFWIGCAVLLIIHLGTALPNAPANVGTYQFFCVVGLGLFGVDKTLATGFSVVVFILLTVPLWGLGIVALGRSGMTLREIMADLRRFRSRGRVASPS